MKIMLKTSRGFSAFAVMIVLTLVTALVVLILVNQRGQLNRKNPSDDKISQQTLKDISVDRDYLISTEDFFTGNFDLNKLDGADAGYYTLEYKNPWGIKGETDDTKCTTTVLGRGPKYLGELTFKLNCPVEKYVVKVDPSDVIVSKIVGNAGQDYIIRHHDSSKNVYYYLFIPKKAREFVDVKNDILTNEIRLGLFAFTAAYSPGSAEKLDEGLRNADTIINSLQVKNLGKPITGAPGVITGEINLEYKVSNYQNVKDDISVTISEKRGVELNYFGIPICDTEKDDCIWLVSAKGNKRVYKYRLTFEGGADMIRIGEYYLVQVSTRHYNDIDGNIAGVTSDTVNVTIPENGTAIQNFDLVVNNGFN